MLHLAAGHLRRVRGVQALPSIVQADGALLCVVAHQKENVVHQILIGVGLQHAAAAALIIGGAVVLDLVPLPLEKAAAARQAQQHRQQQRQRSFLHEMSPFPAFYRSSSCFSSLSSGRSRAPAAGMVRVR